MSLVSSVPRPGGGFDLFAEAPHSARDRLLAATHELLVERIHEPVSLTEICSRAGLNTALVKYYFGNKDGLFAALRAHLRVQYRADIDRIDRSDRTPTEKLAIYVENVVRTFARYPYIAYILRQEHGDDEIARFVGEYLRPALSWHSRLIAEGRKRGEFRDVDPRFLMFSIVGACHFLFVVPSWIEVAFGKSTLSEADIDAFVEHTTEMVLRSVSASSARRRRKRTRKRPGAR